MIDVWWLQRDADSASDRVADARWLADPIMTPQHHAESVTGPGVAQARARARGAAEAIANGRHCIRTMD